MLHHTNTPSGIVRSRQTAVTVTGAYRVISNNVEFYETQDPPGTAFSSVRRRQRVLELSRGQQHLVGTDNTHHLKRAGQTMRSPLSERQREREDRRAEALRQGELGRFKGETNVKKVPRVGWVWETVGVIFLITDPTSQAGVCVIRGWSNVTHNFRGYSCHGDIRSCQTRQYPHIGLLTAPQLKAGQTATESLIF